jgi:hypothetical protein
MPKMQPFSPDLSELQGPHGFHDFDTRFVSKTAVKMMEHVGERAPCARLSVMWA